MRMKSAVVIGVGAERGLGAALCRRFASEGFHVYVLGRSREKLVGVVDGIRAAGASAEAVLCDATSEADIVAFFGKVFAPDAAFEPPELAVFNAGNNKRIDFGSLTAEDFEAFWRVGAFAGFLFGREAARHMVPLGRGSVIFTGASASLRGRPGFAHFASSKAGLRMISQSMAREFGPAGLHVAHVLIDGLIDGDRVRISAPSLVEAASPDELLDIDAIAESYLFLHRQPRSAWTQELDLRPFRERF